MGLYQFKEFLTLDDVADYLRDKGVYDFDLSSDYGQHRLKDWLGVQVRSSKIKPVVYYSERFFAEAIKDYLHANEVVDTLEVFFDGYITFEKYIYAEILELGFKNLYPVSICTVKYETQHITMDYLLGFDFSILHDDLNSFDDFVKKNKNLYIRYFVWDLPKNRKLTLSDILYPKSDLDALFNAKDDSQQQIADLQADNAKLKARIAELESQANAAPANDDIELTGTSKKAATRLLYALLREHNYSIDGTTKGATNQILENLTTRHNVGISRQTIANWLSEINTLHYNKNK